MRATIKIEASTKYEKDNFVYLDGVKIPCQNIDGLHVVSENTITVSAYCDIRLPDAWDQLKFKSMGYPVKFIVGDSPLKLGRAILRIKQKGIGIGL